MRTPVFGVRMVCSTRALHKPLRRRTINSKDAFASIVRTLRMPAARSTQTTAGLQLVPAKRKRR
eukprot:1904230-Lingulodinium_polyedra.AAC.1